MGDPPAGPEGSGMMQQVIPLEILAPGEEGRIQDVDGDQRLVTRLAEMGLRQGVEVRMIANGSPCIIAFDNHRISFRADEDAVVLVEVRQPA